MAEDERERVDQLVHLGQIGLDQGYWQQAETYFDAALESAPQDVRALIGKARACRDLRRAQELVRRALRIAPDHPDALAMEEYLQSRRAPSERPVQPPASVQPPVSVEQQAVPAPPGPPSLDAQESQDQPTGWTSRPVTWSDFSPLTIAAAIATVVGIALLSFLAGRATLDRPSPTVTAAVPEPSPRSSVVITPTMTGGTALGASMVSPRRRAELATVLVLVPDRQGDVVRGSGIIVAPEGLVLTNHHVVGTSVQQGTSQERNLAFVGLTQDVHVAPTYWFIAATVATDRRRDLAVLRIIATTDGRPVDTLRFGTILFGDSLNLMLGQGLIGLGYPALGGDTLTLTRGSMAGFVTDGDGVQYGKTDSELLPGSSGGAVLDDEGYLVGVITAAYTDHRTQGRLSYFVLIEQTEGILQESRRASRPTPDIGWAAQAFDDLF